MNARDPLHWSALLFGVAALAWALTAVPVLAGLAAGLALLSGLAASVIGIVVGLRMSGITRGPFLGGAALTALAHGIFVVAFIGANPVNFKGEPGRGINQDPPAAFTWLIDNVATWIPLILVVGAIVAFWLLWAARERGLGIGALAIIALVLILSYAGVGDTSDTAGTVYQALFALGFLALAGACLVPLFVEDAWPETAGDAAPAT